MVGRVTPSFREVVSEDLRVWRQGQYYLKCEERGPLLSRGRKFETSLFMGR